MKSDLVWLVSESSIDCKYRLNERGLHLQCFGKWEDLSEERGRCSAQNLKETADLITYTEEILNEKLYFLGYCRELSEFCQKFN